MLHTPDGILAFLTFRKQRTRRGWVLSRVQDKDVAWRNENSIMTSPMRGHWFALQTDRWLFYKNQIKKNWVSGQTCPPQEGGTVKNLHVCHYADCGKKYKKTSHLRAHLRWHIGDQPFHCSWEGCGRKFTRSDELHRHFRIHTGEKNHICEVCQKVCSVSTEATKIFLYHKII